MNKLKISKIKFIMKNKYISNTLQGKNSMRLSRRAYLKT